MYWQRQKVFRKEMNHFFIYSQKAVKAAFRLIFYVVSDISDIAYTIVRWVFTSGKMIRRIEPGRYEEVHRTRFEEIRMM